MPYRLAADILLRQLINSIPNRMRSWIVQSMAFLFFWHAAWADPAIVFIHLGSTIPDYLPTAALQARLFNPNLPIYIIANQKALQNSQTELSSVSPIFVEAEKLPIDLNHKIFLTQTRLDRKTRGGFWLYATERFFYLLQLMKTFALTGVIHLESDNMLYADILKILPVLQARYSERIGAPFDHDGRGMASFFYVSDTNPLEQFTSFIASHARMNWNDMEFLAHFREQELGQWIDHLPIAMPSYSEDYPLISPHGHRAKNPELYVNHAFEFGSIFDAAALGQYLGGEDPRNGPQGPGFVNESCVINPSFFEYEWIEDEEGRKIPFAVYRGCKWKINNLHIHCKHLKLFYSMR